MTKATKPPPKPKKITDEAKTIGKVPPLAPGETNPMWEIEKGLPSILKRVVPILNARRPKKRKARMSKHGNFTMVEIPEEDIDNVEEE